MSEVCLIEGFLLQLVSGFWGDFFYCVFCFCWVGFFWFFWSLWVFLVCVGFFGGSSFAGFFLTHAEGNPKLAGFILKSIIHL